MKGRTREYIIALTDSESRLLQESIRDYFADKGLDALFSDARHNGELITLLDIWKEINFHNEFCGNEGTVYLVRKILSTAYSKYQMQSIKDLFDDLKDYSFKI